MQTFYSILFFTLGVVVGAFLFHIILLRLFYMIPKAIYFISKKIVRPSVLLAILLPPFLFFVIFFMIMFFFPSLNEFIENHPIIGAGANLNNIWLIVKYGFTDSGKESAKADFWLVALRHTGNNWMKYIEEQNSKSKRNLMELRNQIEERLSNF